jgi:ATP-dependent exoDNAse (exonuclease V) alpha subunit
LWSSGGDPDCERLRGTVGDIIHQGKDGFFVALVLPDGVDPNVGVSVRRQKVTLTGSTPDLSVGDVVTATGRWRRHRKHGRQFMATSVTKRSTTPTEDARTATLERARTHLASRLIQGVGPRTADRIVGHFGEETAEVLDGAPHRLAEVHGIGTAQAARIAKAWMEQRRVRETMAHLQGLGLPLEGAVMLYRRFGDEGIIALVDRLRTVAPNDRYAAAHVLTELVACATSPSSAAP